MRVPVLAAAVAATFVCGRIAAQTPSATIDPSLLLRQLNSSPMASATPRVPNLTPSPPPDRSWFRKVVYGVFKTDALTAALKGRSLEAVMIDYETLKRIEIIGGYTRVPVKTSFVRGGEIVNVAIAVQKSEPAAELDYEIGIGTVTPPNPDPQASRDPRWSMLSMGHATVPYDHKTYFRFASGRDYTVVFRWVPPN
jgi:hypothetical protein